MEPVIATAIISGIVSGAAAAATQTTLSGIGAAYTSLKNLLVRKYGEENKVTEAVERLEQEPDSEGWKLLLKEAAAKAEADKDAELVKAAEALLEEVKKVQGGEKAVQTVIGGSGHIFSQSGNVTVTRDK